MSWRTCGRCSMAAAGINQGKKSLLKKASAVTLTIKVAALAFLHNI